MVMHKLVPSYMNNYNNVKTMPLNFNRSSKATIQNQNKTPSLIKKQKTVPIYSESLFGIDEIPKRK